MYLSVALLVSVLSYGAFRYLAGETLPEKYWMVVLGLMVLTGPSINYLISTSRSNETKQARIGRQPGGRCNKSPDFEGFTDAE